MMIIVDRPLPCKCEDPLWLAANNEPVGQLLLDPDNILASCHVNVEIPFGWLTAIN